MNVKSMGPSVASSVRAAARIPLWRRGSRGTGLRCILQFHCGFPVAMPTISAMISSSAVAPMMTFIVVTETLSLMRSYSL